MPKYFSMDWSTSMGTKLYAYLWAKNLVTFPSYSLSTESHVTFNFVPNSVSHGTGTAEAIYTSQRMYPIPCTPINESFTAPAPSTLSRTSAAKSMKTCEAAVSTHLSPFEILYIHISCPYSFGELKLKPAKTSKVQRGRYFAVLLVVYHQPSGA